MSSNYSQDNAAYGGDLSGSEFAQERIQVFIDQVVALKERKLVAEILERELMLTLINAHQDHILEYPLIAVQQRSIVHALTIRAAENEALYPYLRGVLEAFIAALTAYSRADPNDQAGRANLLAATLNHEAVLIKCVQGATYAFALCQDNFMEVLLRRYGENAGDYSDSLIQEYEMDDVFWRKHFEHFCQERVDRAFEDMTAREDFILNKTGNSLVLTYPLDALMLRLREGGVRIRKSQIQSEVESTRDFESPAEAVYNTVHAFLRQSAARGVLALPAQDIEFISRITSLDPCAKELHKLTAGDPGGSDSPNIAGASENHFSAEQVLAMACAVGISLDILRRDFIKGLPDMDAQSVDILTQQVADFSLFHLDKAVYFLAEYRLAQILRDRCGESISKMQIFTSRTRRAPVLAVDQLLSRGLSKIKRNRIWAPDPDSQDQLLFRARTAKELNDELDFLVVEPPLKKEILLLWQRAGYKVEFNVAIMLSLLAQTTTNLNYRLTEILGRFGVKLA